MLRADMHGDSKGIQPQGPHKEAYIRACHLLNATTASYIMYIASEILPRGAAARHIPVQLETRKFREGRCRHQSLAASTLEAAGCHTQTAPGKAAVRQLTPQH